MPNKKIKFAKIALDDLSAMKKLDGSIRHQERSAAFLMHVSSAFDEISQKINRDLNLGLMAEKARPKKVSEAALKKYGKSPQAISYEAMQNPDSWLHRMGFLRNKTVHQQSARMIQHDLTGWSDELNGSYIFDSFNFNLGKRNPFKEIEELTNIFGTARKTIVLIEMDLRNMVRQGPLFQLRPFHAQGCPVGAPNKFFEGALGNGSATKARQGDDWVIFKFKQLL